MPLPRCVEAARASLLALLLLLPPLAQATERGCNPRSAADWMAKCSTADGRAEIERLLPECRRRATFARIDTVREVCDILRLGEGASACDRARRQLLAGVLNWASGRLGPDCCIEWEGRQVRLGDVIARHDEDCQAGRRCETIRAFFAAVNDADQQRRCGGGGTPPPPAGDDCCTPRSKGFWHRQCIGSGATRPADGRGRGPGIHSALSEAELRRVVARSNRRLESLGTTACDALDVGGDRTPRGRALAQYAALVLNFEAGFLDGCGRRPAEDGLARVARLIERGAFDEAKDVAERVNGGVGLRVCDDRTGGSGRGGDDSDSDSDGDSDSDSDGKGKGQGQGKAKGKDKKP